MSPPILRRFRWLTRYRQEALRLYPPVLSGSQRAVPKGSGGKAVGSKYVFFEKSIGGGGGGTHNPILASYPREQAHSCIPTRCNETRGTSPHSQIRSGPNDGSPRKNAKHMGTSTRRRQTRPAPRHPSKNRAQRTSLPLFTIRPLSSHSLTGPSTALGRSWRCRRCTCSCAA